MRLLILVLFYYKSNGSIFISISIIFIWVNSSIPLIYVYEKRYYTVLIAYRWAMLT
jgi:hypothetical protein